MITLDDFEASLALHALRFYMNAKGYEVSDNSRRLEAKLNSTMEEKMIYVGVTEFPKYECSECGNLLLTCSI